MITEFLTQNFKSIRYTEGFDFVDFKHEKCQLICGKNGSGKSSFVDAFYVFTEILKHSLKDKAIIKRLIEPSLFSEKSKNENTSFSVTFLLKGRKYSYFFAVKNGIIIHERLDCNETESFIFKREDSTITLSEDSQIVLPSKLSENTLLLTCLANSSTGLICDIYDALSSILVLRGTIKERIEVAREMCLKGGTEFLEKVLNFMEAMNGSYDINFDKKKNAQALKNHDLEKEGVFLSTLFVTYCFLHKSLANGNLLVIDDFGQDLDSKTLPKLLSICMRDVNASENTQFLGVLRQDNLLTQKHLSLCYVNKVVMNHNENNEFDQTTQIELILKLNKKNKTIK